MPLFLFKTEYLFLKYSFGCFNFNGFFHISNLVITNFRNCIFSCLNICSSSNLKMEYLSSKRVSNFAVSNAEIIVSQIKKNFILLQLVEPNKKISLDFGLPKPLLKFKKCKNSVKHSVINFFLLFFFESRLCEQWI